MKNGTTYATQVKKAYAKLRHGRPKVEIPEPDDPVRRMAIALLGVSTSDERGTQALDKLLSVMTDWNEVRVSTPFELCKAIGDGISDCMVRSQNLISALRSVYHLENKPSLERVKTLGRREARQYLEQLNGMDDYAVASVVLWSLGGHAVPVNDALLGALREADLVDPTANRSEVQAFLERHVAAPEVKEFCLIFQTLVTEPRGLSSRSKSGLGTRGKKTQDK